MAGNVGMPIATKKTIQLSASVDYNSLQTFLTGREKVSEVFVRERNTISYLLESSYTFNDFFSIDLLIPYVIQERRIQQTLVSTAGFGDIMLLPKVIVKKRLTIGVGVKAPVGKTDRTDNGIPLIIDLQSGSGAWDVIYHGSYIDPSVSFLPTLSSFITLNVRNTGTNKTYLDNFTYRFGSEIQIIAGISNRFIVFQKLMLDSSLKLRYRHAARDVSDGVEIANSGGKWLFANPGLSFILTPRFSFQSNLELPLYQEVSGTQLSPTYRLNTGVFITIKPKKHDFK